MNGECKESKTTRRPTVMWIETYLAAQWSYQTPSGTVLFFSVLFLGGGKAMGGPGFFGLNSCSEQMNQMISRSMMFPGLN